MSGHVEYKKDNANYNDIGASSQEISVICTVKNESENIRDLIYALLEQTLQPDEIIFVDGGSTDYTVSILKEAEAANPKIRILEARGANIARGRNIGINAAKYEVIAVTDAGAKPQKDWLEHLARFLDANTDIVSGFYLPDARSRFEWLVGELTFPKIENVNGQTFLPSSRSIMFRKKCWSKVGGYPEGSLTAEDTLFDLRLRDSGFRFVFAKDAIVYWRCRRNFRALFRQWYGYAKGDRLLGLIFRNKQSRRHYSKIIIEGYGTIALIFAGFFLHPIFFALSAILLPSYLFMYYMKRKAGKSIYNSTKYLPYLLLGPMIIGVIHLGQFLGIHIGTLRRDDIR